MSQEKAQLIAPIGHFTVPGLNVAGVVTATSFSGNCTGTASSITKGASLVVGVMTATSFVGDVTGNVTGIGSNTDNLDVGIVTATSFAGNFTGIGSGLTGTPNVVAGVVTATKFVGNTPGTVSKLADGTNINVGVVTATKFVGNTSGLAGGLSAAQNLTAGIVTATGGLFGDGSGLTGAGSTAFIRQVATASTSETVINLNDGNIILYKGGADTTVSFANTATAEDVTFIRDLNSVDYSVSFATGGIVLDGDDYVKSGWTGASRLGTFNFTIEYFWNGSASGSYTQVFGMLLSDANNGAWRTGTRFNSQNCVYFARGDGSNFDHALVDANVNDGNWHHLVFMRKDGVIYIYIDGIKQTIESSLHGQSSSANISGTCTPNPTTLEPYVGYNTRDSAYATGTVSNIRVTRAANASQSDEAAVYPTTSTIRVPSAPLTAINSGGFLLAQSTSDVMANGTGGNGSWGEYGTQGDPTSFNGTVGTITGSHFSTTITWPSSVLWNSGAPTLIGTDRYSKRGQVFNFTTCDAGGTWYGYEEVAADVTTFQAWVWGRNQYGALGQNQGQSNDTTSYSSPVQLPGMWTKALVGGAGSAGLKPQGQLWTWGENDYGQLGHNNETKYSSPVQVPGTTWSDISMSDGENFSLATKTDGTLWAWGRNQTGNLGQNQAPAQLGQISSPVQIPGTTWTTSGYKVNVASQYGAFCIKQDNTLWAWGSGTAGRLGQNQPPATRASSPVQIPGSWSQIGHGSSRISAIKTDGTLWSWGYNINGGLGLNDAIFRSSPTQIGSGTDWFDSTMIFGGGIATKTDGTMWSWGISYNGSGGRNTASPGATISSPAQIPGTTWYRVTGGSSGSHIATKTDGTLWVFGNNYAGTLGQNNQIKYSSPVQIPGTTWVITGNGEYSNVAFKS